MKRHCHGSRLSFVSPRSDRKHMNAVRECFLSVLAPIYGEQESALRKIRFSEDRKCRVAYPFGREDQEPVGLVVFKRNPTEEHAALGLRNSLEVKTLLLLEANRTSGHGFGTELLSYVMSEAREAGARSVHVTVSDEVPQSIAFFLRRGFKNVTEWVGKYKAGVSEFLFARAVEETGEPLQLSPPRKFDSGGSITDQATSKFVLGHRLTPTQSSKPDCSDGGDSLGKNYARSALGSKRSRDEVNLPTGRPAHAAYNTPSGRKTQRRMGDNWSSSPDSMQAVTELFPVTSQPSRPAPRKVPGQHYEFTLMKKYLHLLRSGRKTVEGRINSGRFRAIRAGDTIRFFYNACPTDDVIVEVVGIRGYRSFEEMLSADGLEACLPGCRSLAEGVAIYDAIPGFRERAARSGVVGLHVRVVPR